MLIYGPPSTTPGQSNPWSWLMLLERFNLGYLFGASASGRRDARHGGRVIKLKLAPLDIATLLIP